MGPPRPQSAATPPRYAPNSAEKGSGWSSRTRPDTETPGLEREKALRPPQTTAIVGTIKPKSAQQIAQRLLKKLDDPSDLVTFDPLTALLVRYATFPDELVRIYSE